MDDEELLALYRWEPGVCFRHPSKGVVPTAHVETIRPLAGGLQDVRACRECVIDMEKRREALAARSGQAYTPGRLGLLPGSEEA
jgi:hypothetical protein